MTTKKQYTREFHFSGLSEFVGAIKEKETLEKWNPESKSPGSNTWTYGKTLEDAYSLSLTGWKDGVQEIADLQSTELASTQDVDPNRYNPEYSVQGTYIDMPTYYSGEPACMVDFSPSDKPSKPVLRLRVSFGFAGFVTASTVTGYGQAIVAIIDQLENNGTRVELTLCKATKTGKIKAYTEIHIKSAEDALDVDMLAFCLAHPAFNRRLFFRFQETHFDGKLASFRGTYGESYTPTDTKDDTVTIPCLNDIPGALDNNISAKGFFDFFEQQIADQTT